MTLNKKCPIHLSVTESEDKLVQSISDVLKRCASHALDSSNVFRVGLSGGSLVQYVTRALVWSRLDTQCWKFFFCDERYVPHDHYDSTYWAYKTQMISQLPNILESQLIKADTSVSLNECANNYAKRIREEFGTSCPEFDLLLLGMGPDGHTCSLFPEQSNDLAKTEHLIIPIRDSPKPPPERITFTLPLLNNAKNVVFIVTGSSKADIVKRVFVHKDKKFPSAWVEPIHGQLTLIVDSGAGETFLHQAGHCEYKIV